MNEGDLVRVKGTDEVLKVARIHYVRHENDRRPTAECLLPPHDNPNRFVNQLVSDLEKVDPVPAAVEEKPTTNPE